MVAMDIMVVMALIIIVVMLVMIMANQHIPTSQNPTMVGFRQ